MLRSLPWWWLWCSTELWPFMKVCEKWATMNAAAGDDAETHKGEKDLFQAAVSANVMDTHTDDVMVELQC